MITVFFLHLTGFENCCSECIHGAHVGFYLVCVYCGWEEVRVYMTLHSNSNSAKSRFIQIEMDQITYMSVMVAVFSDIWLDLKIFVLKIPGFP